MAGMKIHIPPNMNEDTKIFKCTSKFSILKEKL